MWIFSRLASSRRAAIHLPRRVARFDAVELCKRLTLEGWDHLGSAESRGRGVLLLVARRSCWQLATIAVGLYRGPVHLIGPASGDSLLGRWVDRLEGSLGHRLVTRHPAMEEGEVARRLAAGCRVAMLADPLTEDGEAATVPAPGRPDRAAALIARASLVSGAPVVPLSGWPRARGRYRVAVGEPIEPHRTANAEQLTRRCLERLEAEIRHRPQRQPWWSRQPRSRAGS